MSGDGGERSNRRRQNILSVSIRVLPGRCQPWRERTSRAGRQEGVDRQTVRESHRSCFFFLPIFFGGTKGFFVYRRAENCVATSASRLCICAAGSATKQNQPQGRCGEDQQQRKKKERKRSHAFYSSLCVRNLQQQPVPPSRPRRDFLVGAEETLSHHQDYCCLHSAKKAQRGQLLSASSNSNSS